MWRWVRGGGCGVRRGGGGLEAVAEAEEEVDGGV